MKSIRQRLSDKFPFGLVIIIPIAYLLFCASALLALLLWPFIWLYGRVIVCPAIWMRWSKDKKDVLVVSTQSEHAQEWLSRILPLTDGRAILLDYDHHKTWDRWSLASQLFDIFGPHPIPERFMPYSLPAVIVVREKSRPKTFTFGNRATDLEQRFEKLQVELGRSRPV